MIPVLAVAAKNSKSAVAAEFRFGLYFLVISEKNVDFLGTLVYSFWQLRQERKKEP